MIRILGKIPHRVTIACSGGVDSMSIVHFLLQSKRKVDLAFFNHNTQHSNKAEKFVKEYAAKNNLVLCVGRVRGYRGKRSIEEYWRDERYEFLEGIKSKFIITGHHLDDVVETWLMSAMHGVPKLIPYQRNNIYRPFLPTERKAFNLYAERKGLEWIEDPSNKDTNYMRNHTRLNIMPHTLKINPGIRKTIRKKILETYSDL